MDKKNKFFQSTEEIVSMFLGLIIVLIAGALIFNYFQKRSGSVDLAGVTDTPTVTETTMPLSPAPTDKNTKVAITKPTVAPTAKPTATPAPTKKIEATQVPTKRIEPTAKPTEQVKEAPSQPTENKEYVVKKGDSLWKIAKAHYGSGYNWVDLAKANNLKNPGSLEVGQKLNVPGNIQKKEAVAQAQKPKITIQGNEYTVVKGDNLSTIALRAYGDSYAWTRIYEANKSKISNPRIIHSGLVLMIPRQQPS